MTPATNTKAARRALCADLRRLAELHACAFESVEVGREIDATLRHPLGVRCTLTIHPAVAFVLCWVTDRGVRFSPRFGEVNPFHHGKATKISHDPARDIARDMIELDSGRGTMRPADCAELDAIDDALHRERFGHSVPELPSLLARRSAILGAYHA